MMDARKTFLSHCRLQDVFLLKKGGIFVGYVSVALFQGIKSIPNHFVVRDVTVQL